MAAGLTAYSWGSSRPVSHSDASSSTRSHVLDNDIVSAMRVSRPPTVSVGQAEPREHAPGMRNEQSLGKCVCVLVMCMIRCGVHATLPGLFNDEELSKLL